MPIERQPRKRILIANPDEPRAGDFSYALWDKTKPVGGEDQDLIDLYKKQLRGLRGEHVTLTVRGSRIDDRGITRRFNVRRRFRYNQFSDLFGPGSAYAAALRTVQERNSSEELVTFSLEIEPDDEDVDEYE